MAKSTKIITLHTNAKEIVTLRANWTKIVTLHTNTKEIGHL